MTELCRFFAAVSPQQVPLVLATVLRTEASTYRKAGAAILIGPDGNSSGILSGGCLESDLRERAARVIARNRAERVRFDTREGEDPVFGLGMGCEGAMDVWLQPVLPGEGYRPLQYMSACLEAESAGTIVTVVGGEALSEELGRQGFAATPRNPPVADSDALGSALDAHLAAVRAAQRGTAAAHGARTAELGELRFSGRTLELFTAPVELPPSVLICGAGADAIPVCSFAAALGWRVAIYDHRPAYAQRRFFPGATRVIVGGADTLGEHLDPAQFSAVIVMSHYLPADVSYLRALCASPPPYIGLLGPATRRQRLFAEVGEPAERLAPRIHGPVGLDIGAGTAESIALAIVAEIHAVLAGRPGGAFTTLS